MKQRKNIRIYVDMDSVLVDFQSGIDQLSQSVKEEYKGRLDEVSGIFSLMKPMPGAIEAYSILAEMFDVYILSTAPWNNPSAWSDKVNWVKHYLEPMAHKRLILTHNKSLLRGDVLIDDREKNGAKDFDGIFMHFGTQKYPDWKAILAKILSPRFLEEKA